MGNDVMKLPFWRKLMYALGQFGWSLTSYAVGNLLVYFYLPPETGENVMPPFIFQGAVIGGLTVIGLIFAVGRLFDAVTDPLIAGLSDRGKFKFGRRRTFLAIAIIPFAVLSAVTFIPPVAGVSTSNSIFVFVAVILFYLFMTMYVTPYFALMSEIGHTSNERLQLSTMISITWALGFAVGSQVYAFKGMFEGMGYSPVEAFRWVVIIFALLGFIFMLMPILFIDESKYAQANVSNEGIFEAVKTAFANKNFRRYTFSDLSYFLALTIIQTGMVYYVTILLGQQEEKASLLQIMMFGISFLFYIPTNLIAKKTGKKSLLIVGFVFFAITFAFSIMLGNVPFSVELQGYILVILSGIPLAIFGILPNAIIADIAEADGIETGNYKAGIFFGARTFMSKLGQSIAGILFPSLLLLGRSTDNDLGIRLTSVAAFIFVIAGLLMLLGYNENQINQSLAKKED